MKISEKAKRIWKYVGYAVLALIAITAIIVIWNKWFSRTRVAFINYQATTLGEISKANNNPFVVIEELLNYRLSILIAHGFAVPASQDPFRSSRPCRLPEFRRWRRTSCRASRPC